MRGIRADTRTGCCRDAASRFYWRDNGIGRMRVTLPSLCRLPEPADYCHSNKYPLRVSAIDENARSLRPDFRRVNRRKVSAWGIRRFFRAGSGTHLPEHSRDLNVGAGLLAKTVYQPLEMSTELPHSRASPLPHFGQRTSVVMRYPVDPSPPASSNPQPPHPPAP